MLALAALSRLPACGRLDRRFRALSANRRGRRRAAACPLARRRCRAPGRTRRRAGDQRPDPVRHRSQSGGPPLHLRQVGSAETRARALECLTSAIYYEAGQESREGQRASPRSSSTGSATRPSRPASAASSTRLDAPDRLPVHLHLRWLAGPRPMPASYGIAPARSPQAALAGFVQPAGRQRHPLSRQLCRALLGARRLAKTAVDRRAHLLSLGGGWGRPAAFAAALVGPRSRSRGAAPRAR